MPTPEPTAGPWWLLLSVALLGATSVLVARREGADPRARFWSFVVASGISLGVVSLGTSLVGMYTPGGFLAAQAALLACVAIASVLIRSPRRSRVRGRSPLTVLEWGMLLAIIAIVALSGVERWLQPIRHTDDLMYHASRAAAWAQQGTVLVFESHNGRQSQFPFGAELVFAWGLLFTGDSRFGSILFWSVIPLGVVGVFALTRELCRRREVAFFAALLYACTPTVLWHATTLKSDLWLPVWLMAACFWTVRSISDRRGRVGPAAWLGASVALSMGAKLTTAFSIPMLALVPLLTVARRRWRSWYLGVGAAGIVAGVAVGPLITMGANTLINGHPSGPERLRELVHAEVGPDQLRTHALRIPMVLLDPPSLPAASLRRHLKRTVSSAATALGHHALPLEREGGWPGRFRFEPGATGTAYGLGGLLWLPLAALGLWRAARDARRTWPRVRLSRQTTIMMVALTSFLLVAFLVRWMGAGPGRFWLGAYALTLCAGLALASPLRRWRAVTVVALVLGVWAVSPALRQRVARVDHLAGTPRERLRRTPDLAPALRLIPDGSSILLLAGGNVQDYPLYAPHGRIVNEVHSWGTGDPSVERLDAAIRERDVTHVLFERPTRIGPAWQGVIDVSGLVRHLRQRPDVVELTMIDAGDLVLFATPAASSAAAEPAGPFGGWDVERGLAGAGRLGGRESGAPVRWGIGERTALEYVGRSAGDRLVMECRPNAAPEQTITVVLNGEIQREIPIGGDRRFRRFVVGLDSRPGVNRLELAYTDWTASNPQRRLAVQYRRLRIEAAPADAREGGERLD